MENNDLGDTTLKTTNPLSENLQSCNITKLSALKHLSHVQGEFMPTNDTQKQLGKASERI